MHQAHLSIQGLRDLHSTMYERVSDRRWLAMRLSCLCTAWPSRQLEASATRKAQRAEKVSSACI